MRSVSIVALVLLAGGVVDAAPPPAPHSPIAAAPAPDVVVDSVAALKEARKLGFKQSMMMAYPVKCRAVTAPRTSPTTTAQRAGDPLPFDVAAFGRGAVGIADAVAIYGPPALCSHQAHSRFANLALAPRDAGILGVTLETEDAELIGIILELDPPIAVDMVALRAHFGVTPRVMAGPDDAFEAGGESFELPSKVQVMISHRKTDPDRAWKVHQIIVRRPATSTTLPDAFTTETNLAQLIGVTLGAVETDPVDYAGYLGGLDNPVAHHRTFTATTGRNVASASLDTRVHDTVETVVQVAATFTAPIPVAIPALAGAVGKRLGVALTAIAVDATHVLLDAPAHGRTSLTLDANGRVVAITIAR